MCEDIACAREIRTFTTLSFERVSKVSMKDFLKMSGYIIN